MVKSRFIIFSIIVIFIVSAIAVWNVRSLLGSPTQLGAYVSPSVELELKQLSTQSYDYVTSNLTYTVKVVNNGSELTFQGKPVVIFVGAEWCPYCAAEMWALVITLDRFGNLTGLRYMESSPTDYYPDTPTFTLRNVSYSSNYISLLEYEYQDRNHQPLQSVPQNIYSMWTSLAGGGIPFIDVAGVYYQVGSTVDPGLMTSGNWTYVLEQINSSTPLSREIYSTANLLTAEICEVDGNQPEKVCSQQGVSEYESLLQSGKTGVYVPPYSSTVYLGPQRPGALLNTPTQLHRTQSLTGLLTQLPSLGEEAFRTNRSHQSSIQQLWESKGGNTKKSVLSRSFSASSG